MVYHRTERSEQVRQAMRGRILQAGRTLFAERGFSETTVRDIVEAAETSTGNFYFYFENKTDLLRTLLEGALTRAWTRADTILARTPSGPRKLAVMAYSTALGLLRDERDLVRLIAGNETHAPVQLRLVEINTPRVRGTLHECFPDLPADRLELAVAAWSGAARYCVRLGASDPPLDPGTVAVFIVTWNLRGLGVPEDQIAEAIVYANAAFADRDAADVA